MSRYPARFLATGLGCFANPLALVETHFTVVLG